MPANSTSSIPQMSSIPKEKPQNFPDFILIGAGKSGTTAYHKILSQHPGIYCSTPKEPNFFAYPEMSTRTYGASHQHNIKTEAAYRDLFRAADPSQIRGEASVGYFPQLNTPMRIHHSLPRVKLIAILRHPVDRAYSSWLHRRHDFMEPIDDFHEACQAGPARVASGWDWYWDYLNTGYYAQHLRRWLAYFPRDQIKIFLYEDWLSSPQQVLQDTFRFLGVASENPLKIEKHNISSMRHRSKFVHSILNPGRHLRSLVQKTVPSSLRKRTINYLQKRNTVKASALDPDLRETMTVQFQADIQDLEQLIQRDLSHWHAQPRDSRL